MKPALYGMDTTMLGSQGHLQQHHIDEQQISPLSQGEASWESFTASTANSIPSTPTTQVSVDIHHRPHHDDQHSKLQSLPLQPPEAIPVVQSPWRLLHGDVYFFSFWTSAAQASNLPEHAYSPLEARSSFADQTSSKPVGGLGMIQILSYKDSPVGPYDEMLVVPGSFDWTREEPGGMTKKGRNPKITRIYVSQKHSCYNGRLNWNTPKHLAKFDWDHKPDGSTTVKVFPYDTNPNDPHDSMPSSVPFFRATYQPIRFAPRFPFATSWVDYFGLTSTIVMPPLPAGEGSQGELPGTNRWLSLIPQQYCRRTALGWMDISQHLDSQQKDAENATSTSSGTAYENFWPGLGRWQLGLKMEDADLSFEQPLETWGETTEAPKPRALL